jgi:glycerol-3-phosphate dehydrogenase (NAD(P)+)
MNVPIERATIIGDGAMGTVCGLLLAGKDIAVTMWGVFPEQAAAIEGSRENLKFLPGHKLPDHFRVTSDAAEAFKGAELVVNAVPCQYTRKCWEIVGEECAPDARIVSVAKGIEVDTLLRPTQIVAEFVPRARLGVLCGPSIAPEVADGLPAAVVVASDDEGLAVLAQNVLSTRHFRVYTNPDPLGVELAGATKNVVALAAGIIDGIGGGDNAKAALLTRGMVEITRLGVALGALADTFRGLAGIGDLITTCISPVGRNRSAGEKIGKGQTVEEVVEGSDSVIEGIPTTKAVLSLAREYRVEMPITEAVYSVLFEHLPADEAIDLLMARQLKPE